MNGQDEEVQIDMDSYSQSFAKKYQRLTANRAFPVVGIVILCFMADWIIAAKNQDTIVAIMQKAVAAMTYLRLPEVNGRSIVLPLPAISFFQELTAKECGILVLRYVLEAIPVLLTIIGAWRLFEKADIRGWKIFIPLFHTYYMFEVMDVTGLPVSLLPFAVMYFYWNRDTHELYGFLLCCSLVCLASASLIMLYRLGVRFGHGIGFFFGMLFLFPLFFLILCWDGNVAEPIDRNAKKAARIAAIILSMICCVLIVWQWRPEIKNTFDRILHNNQSVQSLPLRQGDSDRADISETGGEIPYETPVPSLPPREQMKDSEPQTNEKILRQFRRLDEVPMEESASIANVPEEDTSYSAEEPLPEGYVPDSSIPYLGNYHTVCPICNGSGMQYIPNMIYDVNMGWYDAGFYAACGGCGGSGYIG